MYYSFLLKAHHPSRLRPPVHLTSCAVPIRPSNKKCSLYVILDANLSSHTAGPSQRANRTIESQMIEATETCWVTVQSSCTVTWRQGQDVGQSESWEKGGRSAGFFLYTFLFGEKMAEVFTPTLSTKNDQKRQKLSSVKQCQSWYFRLPSKSSISKSKIPSGRLLRARGWLIRILNDFSVS